jgi:hypothetical protein
MAKRENPNQIPKKFRKLEKSFLDHLPEKNTSSLMAFPRGLSFYGKEKDENVVLVVRSPWIVYSPFLLVALLVLLFPFFLTLINTAISENMLLFLTMFVPCLTVSLSIVTYSFVRWFYNVNIVTDKRVIDLDFTTVVSHKLSEARLTRIEDITHKQNGILGSVFDVGTVYFQTAGASPEIEFDNIVKPRMVQDILYDLLDSKKKGKI